MEIDMSSAAPVEENSTVVKISVTNGGAVLDTFDYGCSDLEMPVADFKADLEKRLEKLNCKLRLLIYRGQVLQNGKKLSDYKLKDGETLQLLTWIPESTAAAAAANSVPTPAAPSSSHTPSTPSAAANRGEAFAFEAGQPNAFAFQQGLAHGITLQEEVERWSARVKVWTCMLMLIYSFNLLVNMSKNIEETRQEHSSKLAIWFLGFWVAYIGLRAATRYNFSLARGYLYGQMTVALCHLFLMAVRDPSVTPDADDHSSDEQRENILFISFAINLVFWAYIVYGAYRFQRALWMWLQDGAPEHILQSQEEV